MILPIVAYGDPVLKTKALPIDGDFQGLEALLADMWETMYHANGVGLAAPQIGKSIRLFVIDASPFAEEEPALKNFKKVFLNPVISEQWGAEWAFNEGCLSFPELREDIYRKPSLRIRYQDEQWKYHEEEYSGLAARIIQHEYDHIEGIVMTDRMTPLKRTLIRNRLLRISKGEVDAGYPMKYPLKKR